MRSTSLTPADLSNIPKQLWDSGQRYKENVYRGDRHVDRPIDIIKLGYLSFLVAATPSELLKRPYIKLVPEKVKRWHAMRVVKRNDRRGSLITLHVAIDDFYEKLMWDFVTDNGENFMLDQLISKMGSRVMLHKKLHKCFRMRFISGKKASFYGLSSELMRNLREYWLLSKGYPESYVNRFMGRQPRKAAGPKWIAANTKPHSSLSELITYLEKASKKRNIDYSLGIRQF